MKMKKILLAVLAAMLICALSVAGTMALLKQNTVAVTNTFQGFASAGDTTPLAKTFILKEHEVVQNDDGSYSYKLNAENQKIETDRNEYDSVMPGMILHKDPFITIAERSDAPARLYVEVKGTLTDEYVWKMKGKTDTADGDWIPVKDAQGNDVAGLNGGKLYCYKEILKSSEGNGTYEIIDGNKITIPNNATMTNTKQTLEFYAYLAQATVGEDNTPAGVYAACFLNSTNP